MYKHPSTRPSSCSHVLGCDRCPPFQTPTSGLLQPFHDDSKDIKQTYAIVVVFAAIDVIYLEGGGEGCDKVFINLHHKPRST